ncbi:MAG: NUDIX domain-containing protein [Gammaproteobacteria bacterium]|nr:NUDIX domain-containing protein [Gammaproteobacteria bacterium]
MNDLQRTEVVTAFLRHAGKVLLLRRSDNVGSYRGRWAGVSGYLEDATPLAQALREIHEETGLRTDTVHLAARAAPLEVAAPSRAKLWVVHAFLFDVDNPGSVRLDWESAECTWIDPREIGDFKTVPMLGEALQACLDSERLAGDR